MISSSLNISSLKVILHLPSEEKLNEFQFGIAKIQADIVLLKLNGLHISTDDKKKILKELKQEL
jgi:uncharacterized FAD-dependent dehydrogenase